MSERDVARWVVAGLLGAVWLLFAVGNGSILLGWPASRRSGQGHGPKQGQSMVPFIGGLAGAMACLAAPGIGPAWAWVPLVLDAGSAPMLVLFGALMVKEALKKR